MHWIVHPKEYIKGKIAILIPLRAQKGWIKTLSDVTQTRKNRWCSATTAPLKPGKTALSDAVPSLSKPYPSLASEAAI